MAGRLVVRHGDPSDIVPALAVEVGAERVHVTADAGPYGRRRDIAVARALDAAGRRLVATGTPYAVGPGTITQRSGEPYQVFSPFLRAWTRHGAPAPAPSAPVATGSLWARDVATEELPPEPDLDFTTLPEVGEEAALARWQGFRNGALEGYDENRDRPDVPGTSALSAHLKYGEIHPRTLLADIGSLRTAAADRYRDELCWREFYADVLWHRPGLRAGEPATRVRPDEGRRARRPVRRLARGPYRIPVRGRRDAPASRRGVGAQSGPHGRRQLLRQGPPPLVAARRPMVHAAAARRRPGQQPARLAVGRRQRHRPCTVLPYLQSRESG
jgi:deoxyribodipyrimidine photo-lyase